VLTQEQFNEEVHNDLAAMLTQEPCGEKADERQREKGGAERRAGEAAKGDEEDDDDEDDDDVDEQEGYESPEDPFPHEPRRRLTEEELDKDFDPNEEVGI
jgi:hypothetical protein